MLMGTDRLPVLVKLWLRPSLRSSVCPNTFPRFPSFPSSNSEAFIKSLKLWCLQDFFCSKCWVFSFNVFYAYITGLNGRASKGHSHQYCHSSPVLGQFWNDVQLARTENLSLTQRMRSGREGGHLGEKHNVYLLKQSAVFHKQNK